MIAQLNPAALLQRIESGDTVLFPNSRAARAWRQRFDALQRERGVRAWEPPSVFAWSEWTSSLWTELILDGVEDRVLLNRVQEESIWAEIMRQTPATANLAPETTRDLQQLARSAFALAAAYNACDRLRAAADSFDSRTFADWVQSFRDHCTHHKLLSPALLEHTLARHIGSGALRKVNPICPLHDEPPTPAQSELLSALAANGTPVEPFRLTCTAHHSSARLQTIAPDGDQELALAVRWVRDHALRHPGAALAIIAPDVTEVRRKLERQLRDELAPELTPVGADLSSTPWQFASDPPLHSQPIIAHALQLLRWTLGRLPLEGASQLLLSPFFEHTDSLESRARFELRTLRRAPLLIPELGLEDLFLLRRPNEPSEQSPLLPEFRQLHRLAEQKAISRSTRSHAEWADLARDLLSAVGWPGPRPLSPAEFRATEGWDSLLDLLATLDFSGRRLSFDSFLQALEHETLQPGTPTQPNTSLVQVLSLAEASGYAFDRAWLLNAVDGALPPAEKPHPLLGLRLQATLAMPGSSAALAGEKVRSSLLSLCDRTGQLLLSAPAQDESGPLRLSPLADELHFFPAPSSDLPAPRSLSRPVRLVEAAENLPLPSLPSPSVEGGARVLELQAACGFRAFASFRLAAEAPEPATLGTDARDHGNLLHRALELFWTDIQTQARLKALTHDERETAVVRAVHGALSRLRSRQLPRDAEDAWGTAFLAVLERRFRRLLSLWLDLELQRGPFTVLAPEQQQLLSVGPLQLRVRPDRIDSVEGGFVFVDYKSSLALSTEHWLGERPEAPQLPAYALLAESAEVRGLAFARVRPGRSMGWLSLSDTQGLFPTDRHNTLHELASEAEFWHAELTRLANDFARGDARVAPRSFPETCRHCGHRLLCRLDASTLLAGEPAELTAEEEIDG